MIKAGEKLSKEFIYKHFADEEDVFLFWNGKKKIPPILLCHSTALNTLTSQEKKKTRHFTERTPAYKIQGLKRNLKYQN